ncbi:eukaryotic translation initiation factor 5B-like isoform X2 [Betta splendens]|uniref:Eukaryotic translation initiation factor 5B-like isoform X2 n=1 Tax=Betta splendens TaxID=158456 RepID=A0A9W2Y332_BETSP|nr:eukaryotic translation initiation factor 5B-like isoform X2 [Betta splendens]
MAAPKEKLPSLADLTHMERKTFMKQRDPCLTNSKVRLQQRWQELKERELRAQQHNKELLQQFEKAQDTLKEMLDCTAAMKTIRMEYEWYLKESSPCWQQQLKEKTQAAQRMRMEDNMRSCLKNTKKPEVTEASADQHSQGYIKRKKDGHIHSDYNQFPGIPMRASHQPQSSSRVPPFFLSHPHPFVLHHLSSTPSHHPWPRHNTPGQSSLHADCPWSWMAAADGLPEALWGQLYSKEPPTELMASPTVAQGSEISGASSPRGERCGGRRSSRLSHELDIKPVRLSSGHAESSESDSTQVIRERRKKETRGRSQCTSSEKQSHSSEGSSRSSSTVIIASDAVVQSFQRDVSSGKCKKRRQRSGVQVEQVSEPLSAEKVLKEKNRNKGDESASQRSSEVSGRETEESTGKNAENASADDKLEQCRREDSGSICIQLKCKARDEKQKQIISSEQSSSEEKDEADEHQEDRGENKTEDKEDSLVGDDQDGDVEDEPDEKEKCLKEKEQKEKDEEEADEKEEDELEEQKCKDKDELKKDDSDDRSSASSQDEEDESEQDKTGEDEEGSEDEEQGESEEEQRSDKEGEPEEEESDSEESVISPQDKRRHNIPEEATEDGEKAANKAGFSDGDDSNDFSEQDDIENLLMPQEQRQKREDKDLKPAEKLKVSDLKMVQAEENRSTKITPQRSDSDEFDHFYD